jgi:tetratricopeptide (TPR) repeat protein
MCGQGAFVNKKLGILLLLLISAAAGVAQNAIRGQIILPNGDFPTSPIRYYVSSSDGRFNEYRFTDSNGRFIIERPAVAIELTITVDKNEAMGYDTTVRTVIPQYESTPRIILNPLKGAKTAPGTISAASGYQPVPEATELHKSALKDIEKQQYDAAEPKLRKAVTLGPRFVAAHVDLGALLMQKKEYEDAEAILRRALDADPKSVLALLNLAITLNHLKKHADAIPYLREALRLQPGLVTAHVHLGVALSETDKFDEAEPELQRGVKAGGDEETLGLLYLGKMYTRTGKYQQAVESFEAYLKKVPEAPNAGEVRDLIKKLRQELAARR